ncbi:hypothetical protein BWQ96_05283 [Gracilariopsis chorda]|uniref:Uncharacterized protein n=1 Tax=Gracilariopsis chorda TaxID=448386 RepID=A0A2V3IS26_9FLOR|nr:hypothetical protein BWQ96_05283 [Gracilariopsis chorda]|eukprot:PXF44919.1 hypothetical protein BWQ96_05283 [Gracilariopsis chorda]
MSAPQQQQQQRLHFDAAAVPSLNHAMDALREAALTPARPSPSDSLLCTPSTITTPAQLYPTHRPFVSPQPRSSPHSSIAHIFRNNSASANAQLLVKPSHLKPPLPSPARTPSTNANSTVVATPSPASALRLRNAHPNTLYTPSPSPNSEAFVSPSVNNQIPATFSAVKTPGANPIITHEEDSPSASVKKQIATSQDPQVLASFFKLRSAKFLSPLGKNHPKKSHRNLAHVDVNANPLACTDQQAASIPTAVQPDTVLNVPFSMSFGFEETLDIQLGCRASRVPLPYAINVFTYDLHGSIKPCTARLERDPDHHPTTLVDFISCDVLFAPAYDHDNEHDHDELNSQSENVVEEACLIFWAAPDAHLDKGHDTFVLTVTDYNGQEYETKVDIHVTKTEPLIAVHTDDEPADISRTETTIEFLPHQSSLEKSVTVWNKTAGEAPLLLNVVMQDCAAGAFSIRQHPDEETLCIPMYIPAGESCSFSARFNLTPDIQGEHECYGIGLVKFATILPSSVSPEDDAELYHSYDHVLNFVGYSTVTENPDQLKEQFSPPDHDDLQEHQFCHPEAHLHPAQSCPLEDVATYFPSDASQPNSADRSILDSVRDCIRKGTELKMPQLVPRDNVHEKEACVRAEPLPILVSPDAVEPLPEGVSEQPAEYCRMFLHQAPKWTAGQDLPNNQVTRVTRYDKQRPEGKASSKKLEDNQDGRHKPPPIENLKISENGTEKQTPSEAKVVRKDPSTEEQNEGPSSSETRVDGQLEEDRLHATAVQAKTSPAVSADESQPTLQPQPRNALESETMPHTNTQTEEEVHGKRISHANSPDTHHPANEGHVVKNGSRIDRIPPLERTKLPDRLCVKNRVSTAPRKKAPSLSATSVGTERTVKFQRRSATAFENEAREAEEVKSPEEDAVGLSHHSFGTTQSAGNRLPYVLKRLVKNRKPKIKMPRSVRENGVRILSNCGSAILPLFNATSSPVTVTFELKRYPGSETAAIVSQSMLVLEPQQRTKVVITRLSAKQGHLRIIIASYLRGAVKLSTVYHVPLYLEACRNRLPAATGFAVDRPTITFYNSNSRYQTCSLRVLNGTYGSVPFKVWIGGGKNADNDNGTVFQIISPTEGTVEGRKCVTVEVRFNSSHPVQYYRRMLYISMANNTDKIPIFAYTGSSSVRLSVLDGGIFRAENLGTRSGFVVLSGPEVHSEDNVTEKIVLKPNEKRDLVSPYGSGTIMYTGDEIARSRFCRAVRLSQDARNEVDDEMVLFLGGFNGEENARTTEGLHWPRDTRHSLHYAGRLLGNCIRRYRYDPEQGHIITDRRSTDDSGWQASIDANGYVHIENYDSENKLKFSCKGAEPTVGVIPPLGDAKLAAFVEQVQIFARGTSVELYNQPRGEYV